jgi:hypothetical protein
LTVNSLSASEPSSNSRRRLCKIVGAFFAASTIDLASAASPLTPGIAERAALAAFVDTLLPRDGLSGSATDLGIDQQIWTFSKTEPDFRKLLNLGCRWLDMTGGPPFSKLAGDQQFAVVSWMAQSDWNEIPRRFYELMRQISLELYYSNPKAWHGLPIQSPPQPVGYPPSLWA